MATMGLSGVRHQVRYARPVGPGSRLSGVVWDEMFLHLNTTRATRGGLDQNRAFGGLAVALNPNARLEVGYLNQFINPRNGSDRLHHVLSGVLSLSF